MILNHKEAILFLIENAEEISVTPFVIRNLHQLLSQDLLSDSSSCGKIRQIEVKITKTSYLPLNSPQQLEELFTLLLRKAVKINDPFEQSFFLFMHLSYIQAFEDVNKRTARLSCNLPFIQENLCPLSFVDVPRDDYVKTLIYFYETGDYIPALEVFLWAYERSCEQYKVVEQSIGVIDSYRIKYRSERKQVIGEIIRGMIVGVEVQAHLELFCTENKIQNADKFISITTVELDKLHSGAIISLGVTENIFLIWKEKFDTSKVA
jgi:Fic family protein